MTAPPRIRTDSSNPFANHTIRVRVPALFDEVLERNPDYAPDVRGAIGELRDALAGNSPLPGTGVAVGIEREFAAHDRLLVVGRLRARRARARAPEQRLDALGQEALRERLGDVVVGADIEADHLVHLVVLRGEEDDREVRTLADAAQHFDAVHARHLDVEDGDVGGRLRERGQRRRAVRIGAHGIALALEQNLQGGEDILVVVDQGDGGHGAKPRFLTLP